MTNINDQIRLIFEGKKSLGHQEHVELYKLTVHLRTFAPADPDEDIQDGTVVKLIKSFTNSTHSNHTRRWIGLLLLQALRSANTTLEKVSLGSHDFIKEVSHIVLSSTSEALRIVAGAIIQWERANGVPHDRLWSPAVAQHAELNFPQVQDSQWVENLEGFLDALEDVEGFQDSGADISWASLVTIGDVELPRKGLKPGRVAVILEMDYLTFAATGPFSSLEFIDVPLSNITGFKIEGRLLKSSGNTSTQTAAQLSIQLRRGHEPHSVNGEQKGVETVTIMFPIYDQAKELLVQIKKQLGSRIVSDIQHISSDSNALNHRTGAKPTVIATASMQLPHIIQESRCISAQISTQAPSTKLRDQLRNEKGEAPAKPVQQAVVKTANKSHKKQSTKNEKVNTSEAGSTKKSAKTPILIDSDSYDVPSSSAKSKKHPVNTALRTTRENTTRKTQAKKISRGTRKKPLEFEEDDGDFVNNQAGDGSVDPKRRTRASTAKMKGVPPSNNVQEKNNHGTGTNFVNGTADGYDAHLLDGEQEDEMADISEAPKLPYAQEVQLPKTMSNLLANPTVADRIKPKIGNFNDQEVKPSFEEGLTFATKENPIIIEDVIDDTVFQWDNPDGSDYQTRSVNPADLLLDRSIRKPSLIAFNIDGPVNQGTRVSDPILRPTLEEQLLPQTLVEDLSDAAAHLPFAQSHLDVHIPSKRLAVESIALGPEQKRAKSSHHNRDYGYDDTAHLVGLDMESFSSSPEPPRPTGSQLSRRVDFDGSPQPANIRLPLYTSSSHFQAIDTQIDLDKVQSEPREHVELISQHAVTLNGEAVDFDEIQNFDMQIAAKNVAATVPIHANKARLSKFMQALLGSVGRSEERKENESKPNTAGTDAGLWNESGNTLVEEEAMGEISMDGEEEDDPEESEDSDNEQDNAMTLSTSPSSHSQDADAGEEGHDKAYDEELEWEDSLKPHQYGIADALGRITKRLLRHLADKEIAVEGKVSDYKQNGLRLINHFKEAHQDEFDEAAAELAGKRDVLIKGLRLAAQGLNKERHQVKSLAAGFEEVVCQANLCGKRHLSEVGRLMDMFGTHRPLQETQ